MDIGYARVSTGEQTLDLQLDALTSAGCGTVYQETASGAKADRPVLDDVLSYLRTGDTLVVWRLDRLGRSLQHSRVGSSSSTSSAPWRSSNGISSGSAPRPDSRRREPAGDWEADRRSWPMPSSSSWRGLSMMEGMEGRPTSPRSAPPSASRGRPSTGTSSGNPRCKTGY